MSVAEMILIVALVICFGSSLVSPQCQVDQFTTQANFDQKRFEGTWYEIRWLPHYMEPTSDYWIDYTETYKASEDGTKMMVNGTGRPNKASPTCLSFERVLGVDVADKGKMHYQRSFDNTEYTIQQWVLNTDYVNWAYVYGCDVLYSNGTCDKAHGTLWSRQPTLNDPSAADAAITQSCLQIQDFISLEQQKSCFGSSGFLPLAPVGATYALVSLLSRLLSV